MFCKSLLFDNFTLVAKSSGVWLEDG